MQRSLFIACLLINCLNLSAGKEDQTSAETLGKVANLVGHFGKVLAQPNNPAVVSSSICGMISSILGMAADTRNKIAMLELETEIKDILESGDSAKIKRLQANLELIYLAQIKSLNRFIK